LQAIEVLYTQYYEPKLDRLIRILSGFVFLGSPHPSFENPHEWTKLPIYLRAKTKLSKHAIDRNASQVSAVARISEMFKELAATLPVLTIVETKPTNIGSTFISSKRLV
jgi:hypothetical protein